jgi:hypothetical protein
MTPSARGTEPAGRLPSQPDPEWLFRPKDIKDPLGAYAHWSGTRARMLTQADYYRARAQEERLAAEISPNDEARRAHLELAFRYERIADELHKGSAACAPGAAAVPNDRAAGSSETRGNDEQ